MTLVRSPRRHHVAARKARLGLPAGKSEQQVWPATRVHPEDQGRRAVVGGVVQRPHRTVVARQLGHADVAMVAKVYGRFAPTRDERDRREGIAAQNDQKSHPLGYRGGYL